jgi:hypothetical protein
MSTEERFRTSVIDADHLAHQREWSRGTFGPGPRTFGVLDHIRKELTEIEANPSDLSEWVDVIILAFDGAWRAGWEPQEIIDAVKAKQAVNEGRSWPDWRTATEHEAIEHNRSEERFRSPTTPNPHTQPIDNPHCQQINPNHWRHWYRHYAQPGDRCLCGDDRLGERGAG